MLKTNQSLTDDEINHFVQNLMEKFKYKYRCASVDSNIWYTFKNHRWIQIDSTIFLKKMVSRELIIEYGKMQAQLFLLNQCSAKVALDGNHDNELLQEKIQCSAKVALDGNHDNELLQEKIQCHNENIKIYKIIERFNNPIFGNIFIKKCVESAYDPNFFKRLDKNVNLICFNNGVYDLNTNKFRIGHPGDYISLCTHYEYVEYNNNSVYHKEIKYYFKKIQPNKTMRNYLLTVLAACLTGSVSDINSYIFIGKKSNGSSKLMEFMRYTFGDLFKQIDPTLWVQGKNLGDKHLLVSKENGKRICVLDDTQDNNITDIDFMKIINVSTLPRKSNDLTTEPHFKSFLLRNYLPIVRLDDNNYTLKNIKVIHFPSEFFLYRSVSNLKENQFWADTKLSECLLKWKQTFMSILIHYYKKYKTTGLIHPKPVMNLTNYYRECCYDHAVFKDYIHDFLDKTGNSEDSVSIQTIYNNMKYWYRGNYNGKVPCSRDFKSYIIHKMTSSFNNNTNSLIGYKLKTKTDSELLSELFTLNSTG
jgi:phage/plasmid-associated DNA primase